MSSSIRDIRAMLLQFERSSLKDLYFRSSDWVMFLARPGGGTNPLLAFADCDAPPPVIPLETLVARAPHLGLFEPRCAVGVAVCVGDLLGLLDVLGRKTEVFSTAAGRVSAVRVFANDLVEFGDPLVEIEAAA